MCCTPAPPPCAAAAAPAASRPAPTPRGPPPRRSTAPTPRGPAPRRTSASAQDARRLVVVGGKGKKLVRGRLLGRAIYEGLLLGKRGRLARLWLCLWDTRCRGLQGRRKESDKHQGVGCWAGHRSLPGAGWE